LPISELILGKKRLRPPVWYGISNRSLTPQLTSESLLKSLLSSRANIIQWREKDLSEQQNQYIIRQGCSLAKKHNKIFLVNTFVSIALIEQADGVHLTSIQDVRTVDKMRTESGIPDWIIGKSVHSLEDGLIAEDDGANYLIIGPVFNPISKRSFTPPLGLEMLSSVCDRLHIPVFAVGGISQENYQSVIDAGAAGVAGISWVLAEINDS